MTLQEWSKRYNVPLTTGLVKTVRYEIIPQADTLPARATLHLTTLEDYTFVSLVGCAAWLVPKEKIQ